MITDLLEGRRCRCGSGRFSRLWSDETKTRLSFVILCETCGRLDRAAFSDTTPGNQPRTITASQN